MKTCSKSKNIHADHKEHLVHHQDNGNATRYEEEEKQFIEEAHEYLIDSEFNKNFDLEKYRKSGFFRNLKEIKLKSINEKHIQV